MQTFIGPRGWDWVFEGGAFGADLYVIRIAYDSHDSVIKNYSWSGFLKRPDTLFHLPVIGATGINRDDSWIDTPTCLAVVVQHLVEMLLATDDLWWILKRKIPGIVVRLRRWQNCPRMDGWRHRQLTRGTWSTSCERQSFPKTKYVKSRQNGLCCTGFWKEYCLDWSRSSTLSYANWVKGTVMSRSIPMISPAMNRWNSSPMALFYQVGLGDPHQVKNSVAWIKKLNGQIPIRAWAWGVSCCSSWAESAPIVKYFGLNIPVRELRQEKSR